MARFVRGDKYLLKLTKVWETFEGVSTRMKTTGPVGEEKREGKWTESCWFVLFCTFTQMEANT